MFRYFSIFIILCSCIYGDDIIELNNSTELGEIILGEEKKFSVELLNTTNKEVVVELKNYCSCVRLNEPVIQLPAKGKASFTGLVYSYNVRGVNLKQEILLYSNSKEKSIFLTGNIKKAYDSPSIFVLESNLKAPKKFKVQALAGFPKIKSITFSNANVGVELNFNSEEKNLDLSLSSSPAKGLQGYLLFNSSKEDFPVIKFPVYVDNICKMLPMVKYVSVEKTYDFVYTSPSNILDITDFTVSEGVLSNKRKINDFTWKISIKVPKDYNSSSISLTIKNNLTDTPDIRIIPVRKK